MKFTFPENSIELSCSYEEKAIKLHIKDGGPGLSLKEIQTILDTDLTNQLNPKPSAGESSHGVGLEIVKRFAEELDYKLEIRSKEGEGCVFSLVFN